MPSLVRWLPRSSDYCRFCARSGLTRKVEGSAPFVGRNQDVDLRPRDTEAERGRGVRPRFDGGRPSSRLGQDGQDRGRTGRYPESPNGLPRNPYRSPSAPPVHNARQASTTRSRAEDMSATRKQGSENRSPGPRPRSCSPSAGPSPWLCKPRPSEALRPSRANPSSPSQNCRARARSSAGNSIKSIGITHSAYAALRRLAATVGR